MSATQTEMMLALLHAQGIDAALPDLERLYRGALKRLHQSELGPEREFTKEEAAVLTDGGFDLEPKKLGIRDPIAGAAAEHAALIAKSLTVAEAARKLGVNESRIRQRLTQRPATLYGVKFGSEWRLPRFQFDRAGLLAGFQIILSRLGPEVDLLLIQRWMTRPNLELIHEETGEEPLSPRDWLRMGLSPDTVAELAAEL